MLIKGEDLKKGDEILVSHYSDFDYLRVLRDPVIKGTIKHWQTGRPIFKSVKCSLNKKETISSITNTKYAWFNNICTSEGHNHTLYKDLNNRMIWLVKRIEQ